MNTYYTPNNFFQDGNPSTEPYIECHLFTTNLEMTADNQFSPSILSIMKADVYNKSKLFVLKLIQIHLYKWGTPIVNPECIN